MKVTYEVKATVTSSEDGDRVRFHSTEEDAQKAKGLDRELGLALRFKPGANPGIKGGQTLKITIEG